MTSFASLSAADGVRKKRAGEVTPASTTTTRQQPAGLHIQRKAICACGGGCPRCVQKAQAPGADAVTASPAAIYETAAAGVRGQGALLPYLTRIQDSFGRHDVTGVRGHVDSAAASAAREIDASAYTLDGHIAFDGEPDLFTAAHEAAHAVQQRAGVQLPGGVGRTGDRFEQHADAVASEVVAGRSAERLLDQHAADKPQTPRQPAVQREEPAKAKTALTGVQDAAVSSVVTSTINFGLAKIDEELIKGTTAIRLAIRDDAAFNTAWGEYCKRSGVPPSTAEADMNGFVDPTHPSGKLGFVRAGKGIGTAIHEGMHQRAHSSFHPTQAKTNVNEGTTELFTRVVMSYGGSTIQRNNYEHQKNAMLKLQGICGLPALAKWYFKGDISAVKKSLGSKLEMFQFWMDDPGGGADVATRAQSAIDAL